MPGMASAILSTQPRDSSIICFEVCIILCSDHSLCIYTLDCPDRELGELSCTLEYDLYSLNLHLYIYIYIYLEVAVFCLEPHAPKAYQWPKPAWYKLDKNIYIYCENC